MIKVPLHFPGFAHLARRGSGYQLIPAGHLILMPVAAMTLPQRSISLFT
jgi:hypothetical protein